MGEGDEETQLPRVLSIQSSVVHGYVGNKCAVFPLQLLGFDVDPIYSVQFSNHTGYPSFKGAVFDGEHLSALLRGLGDNGLVRGYTHLLTGYIGNLTLLQTIAEVTHQLRAANGDQLTYGRLYVPPALVGAYRETILPLASVLVPNQYEAELLADQGRIASIADGLRACEALHAVGPHTVIITSMALDSEPGQVVLLASTKRPQAAGEAAQRLVMRIPRVNAYFTGTGDLMAALLLAWMHHHPDDLATAVDKAVAGLQAVLQATARASRHTEGAAERTAEVCAARELRLIRNQARLVDPVVTLTCSPVTGVL